MSAELIFDRLAFAALQGCVAVALAWIVLRLARPVLPPSVRAAAWTIVFSCLLIGLAGSIPLRILPAAPSLAASPLPESAGGGYASVTLASQPITDWKLIIVGAWLAVAAVLMLLTMRQHLRLRRALRKMDFAPVAVQNEAIEIAADLRLRRMPEVRIDPRPQVPFIAGIWNPCVVLPSRLVQPERAEDRAAALAHEIAHLRRGDLYVELLAAVCRCIFFFNPLVWAAAREWAAEREMACDEMVLRRGKVCAKRYCQMLIDFAACRAESSSLVLAVTNGFRHLHRRINQMTNGKKRKRGAAYVYSIAALGLITLGAAPLALKPAPSSDKIVDETAIEQSKIDVITADEVADLELFDEEGNMIDIAKVMTKYSEAEIEVFDEDGNPVSLGTFSDVQFEEGEDGGTVITAVPAVEPVAPTAPAPVKGAVKPSAAPSAPSTGAATARASAPAAALPSAPVPAAPAVAAADIEELLNTVITIELDGATFPQVARLLLKGVGIEYVINGPIPGEFYVRREERTVRTVLDEVAKQGSFKWSVDRESNRLVINL